MTDTPGQAKLFVFLNAPSGRDVPGFHAAVRSALASLPALASATDASTLELVPMPEGLPRRPDDPTDPKPPYDIGFHARFARPEQADAALDALLSEQLGACALHGYHTTEWPVLDRFAEGSESKLKMVALIAFHDDLPVSAMQRSWALHARLASRIHVGAGRYSRNWVERIEGAGAPQVQGIVDIDFAEVRDLVDGYFVDERGRQEVMQDTGHFVKRPTRLYMTAKPL